MSVVEYSEGDLFIARVFKNHTANPSDKWVNTYEFKANAAGTIGDVIDLCEILVEYEQTIHLAVVNFVSVSFSTWEADSLPYDPTAFFSTTTTGIGSNADSSAPLGLNNCLAVARVPVSGRFGHIFYRGILTEDAIQAPAGKTVLTNKPAIQSIISDALTDSGLGVSIGIISTGPWQMVMVNKDGSNVRSVRDLLVQGVSALPTDHAWFNRT